MRTVEQAGIKMLFQLTDLERHCRLRHVQRLRRLGKAEEARHSMKNLESAIGHN